MKVKNKTRMILIILFTIIVINFKIVIIPYDENNKVHIWDVRPNNIQRSNFVCLGINQKTNYLEATYQISDTFYYDIPLKKTDNYWKFYSDERFTEKQKKRHVYKIYGKDKNDIRAILYFR